MTVRPKLGQIVTPPRQRLRCPTAKCRRSIRASALLSRCGPNRPRARGNRCRSAIFSANSEAAAASSRKSISIFTVRASVSTTSTGFSRLVSGNQRSPMRAAKYMSREIAAEPPLDAGPQHFDRDIALAAARRATRARCTCAIEAAATGSPKVDEKPRRSSARRRPRSILTATSPRKGAMWSCRRSSRARDIGADDIRPRREKLPELDVGRAEPADRGGADRGPLASRLRRSIWRGRAAAARPAAAAAISTSRNRPARESTKPARAQMRRNGCPRERSDQSFQPEWIATMPPLSLVKAARSKPAFSIIARKSSAEGNRRIDSTR